MRASIVLILCLFATTSFAGGDVIQVNPWLRFEDARYLAILPHIGFRTSRRKAFKLVKDDWKEIAKADFLIAYPMTDGAALLEISDDSRNNSAYRLVRRDEAEDVYFGPDSCSDVKPKPDLSGLVCVVCQGERDQIGGWDCHSFTVKQIDLTGKIVKTYTSTPGPTFKGARWGIMWNIGLSGFLDDVPVLAGYFQNAAKPWDSESFIAALAPGEPRVISQAEGEKIRQAKSVP